MFRGMESGCLRPVMGAPEDRSCVIPKLNAGPGRRVAVLALNGRDRRQVWIAKAAPENNTLRAPHSEELMP
jgi:hypothetical protein